MAQVQKLRTSPYHPETNGQCERFNQTLLGMLGTLRPSQKENWQDWVSTLTHAYNCTNSSVTNFSPYFLMFGRKPNVPLDLEFGLKSKHTKEIDQASYVKKLREKLEWAYLLAGKRCEKEASRNKTVYDRKFRCMKIEKGDIVLVRLKAMGGNYKIADRWENEPYIVLDQLAEGPVYKVQPVGTTSNKRIRTLHRNMLFPLKSVRET